MAGHRIALALLLLLPASASAGEVSLRATVIPGTRYEGERTTVSGRYIAAPGEVNDVRADVRDGILLLTDSAGVRAASKACEAVSPTAVRCVVTQEFEGLDGELGDGDDRFEGYGTHVRGGAGDDQIDASLADGGAGDDRLSGFEGRGGPGADLLDVKEVSYAAATGPVRVDLRSRARAGQAGERDRLGPRVEKVTGGAFDDVLVGDAGDNALDGGGGHDRIAGLGGRDQLYGGSGPDRIRGGRGDDSLGGGPSADVLIGEAGNDSINGDAGPDDIRGGPGDDQVIGDEDADRLDGGPGIDDFDGYYGADLLLARDGQPDVVRCGPTLEPEPGTRAVVDALDLVGGCARVRRRGAARPLLGFAGPSALEPFTIEVGCSQDLRSSCAVRLEVRVGGRRISRRDVRVPFRETREFPLRIPIGAFDPAAGRCGVAHVTMTARTAAGRRVVTRRAATLAAANVICPERPATFPFSFLTF